VRRAVVENNFLKAERGEKRIITRASPTDKQSKEKQIDGKMMTKLKVKTK
jgi:hypothetical protein